MSREHLATRMLRSVWGLPLRAAADAAGTDLRTLKASLAAVAARGRCAQFLAEAATAGVRAATASEMCPPAAAAALWEDPACRNGIKDPHLWSDPEAIAMVRLARRLRGDACFGHAECPPAVSVAATAITESTTSHVVLNAPCPPAAAFASVVGGRGDTEAGMVAALPHPACPVSVLRHAAVSDQSAYRVLAARNPGLPSGLRRRLLQDPHPEVRGAALSDPGLTAEELARFADGDPHQRHAVAAHPNTPTELRQRLAADPDRFVRSGTAQNPNTGPGTIASLARDEHIAVCSVAATHPACRPEDLQRLASHGDERARTAVAANPNTPAETLETLSANRRLDGVPFAVAANPSSPVSLLDRLAYDSEVRVRRAATSNPSTSDELLVRLCAHWDQMVAAMAVDALRVRLRSGTAHTQG